MIRVLILNFDTSWANKLHQNKRRNVIYEKRSIIKKKV